MQKLPVPRGSAPRRATSRYASSRCATALVAAALSLAPAAALAHGGGGAHPVTIPPAPPGDGQTAERLAKEIAARVEKDAAMAKVVAEPLANARKALERAHGARVSGDTTHARMFDGLALEWAETARELERAAAAEAIALAAAKKAREASTQADRARALLEETQARRARAAAEIERLEADAKDAKKSAADVEDARIEASKRKGGKAPAPPAKKPAEAPKKPAPKKGSK